MYQGVFEQIESCGFSCEGGLLENNLGYIRLKENVNECENTVKYLREVLNKKETLIYDLMAEVHDVIRCNETVNIENLRGRVDFLYMVDKI